MLLLLLLVVLCGSVLVGGSIVIVGIAVIVGGSVALVLVCVCACVYTEGSRFSAVRLAQVFGATRQLLPAWVT